MDVDCKVVVQLDNGINEIFTVKGFTLAADVDKSISALAAGRRVCNVSFVIESAANKDIFTELESENPMMSESLPIQGIADLFLYPSFWELKSYHPESSSSVDEYLQSSISTQSPIPFYRKSFLVSRYYGYHHVFFAGLNAFLTTSTKKLDFLSRVSSHLL